MRNSSISSSQKKTLAQGSGNTICFSAVDIAHWLGNQTSSCPERTGGHLGLRSLVALSRKQQLLGQGSDVNDTPNKGKIRLSSEPGNWHFT